MRKTKGVSFIHREKDGQDSKILEHKNLEEGLEKLLQMARDKKINNVLFATLLPGGKVITASYNLGIIEQHVLMSHLNIDLVARTIEEKC